MFRRRWLRSLRTPPPRTCGSVCATPASSTSGSGPIRLPAVTRTGPRDRDPRGTMSAGWRVPFRPLGGSSGWAYLTGRDWTLSAALVVDDLWRLVRKQTLTTVLGMCLLFWEVVCCCMVSKIQLPSSLFILNFIKQIIMLSVGVCTHESTNLHFTHIICMMTSPIVLPWPPELGCDRARQLPPLTWPSLTAARTHIHALACTLRTTDHLNPWELHHIYIISFRKKEARLCL